MLGSLARTRYNLSLMASLWLDTIGRIFDAVPDLATPAQVQDGLREILEDPELSVYWWDWERDCYVGIDGDPEVPEAVPGTATVPAVPKSRPSVFQVTGAVRPTPPA